MIKETTLGAGCFWCIEACYKDIKGVESVLPGYMGGDASRTSYHDVCKGDTGHAEVARIEYDENVVSFAEILKMFWFIHDPTHVNRQGNDVGTQYRSAIFYHDQDQKEVAEQQITLLNNEKVWDNPIATEVGEVSEFFLAEAYHQNYLENNPGNAYCQSVVRPKVERFKEAFSNKLK